MNTETTATATATVDTFEREFTYHFRAFDIGSHGHERLKYLLKQEAITEDDIELVKEEGKDDKYKRKPVTVKMHVPVVAMPGFTAEQNAHLQELVCKAIKEGNNLIVNDGLVDPLVGWSDLLQEPFTQRPTAVKITAAMVKEAAKLLREKLGDTSMPEQAVNAVSTLAERRFSVAACQGHKPAILERIQGILASFCEMLDMEELSKHEPVLNLWANNLERVLKPKDDTMDEKMFYID